MRQCGQRFVQGQQVVAGGLDEQGIQVDLDSMLTSAALESFPVPRAVNENSPHRVGGRGKEMTAALERFVRVGSNES